MSQFGNNNQGPKPKKPQQQKNTQGGQQKPAQKPSGRAYPFRFNVSDPSSYWKRGGKLTQAAKERQAERQRVAVAMGWVKKGQDFSVQKLRIGNRAETLRKLGLLPALSGQQGTYDPSFTLKDAKGKLVGPIAADVNLGTHKKPPILTVSGYKPPKTSKGILTPPGFQGFDVPPAKPGQSQGQISGSSSGPSRVPRQRPPYKGRGYGGRRGRVRYSKRGLAPDWISY